jgi:RNA polymerase sigma factor (TIGR02999 family)
MSEVTQILDALACGEVRQGAEQLLPLVYDELRRLAAQKLASERPGQTLDATALVHEAYIRLVDQRDGRTWDHRGHFFAAAAEAMRRILADKARSKRSLKRGGGRKRVDLDANVAGGTAREDLLALDGALDKFAVREPLKAQLVKMHFFAGLTLAETAEALGISLATAERYWAYARTWLFAEVEDAENASPREKL